MPQSMELRRVRHDGTTRTLREIKKNFGFPTEISDKPSMVGRLPLFFKPLKGEGGRQMRTIYLTNWCSLLQLVLQHLYLSSCTESLYHVAFSHSM